jgi:hypothetical protein
VNPLPMVPLLLHSLQMERRPESGEPLLPPFIPLRDEEERVTMTPGDIVTVRNHVRALGSPSALLMARQLTVEVDVYPETVTIIIIMRHRPGVQPPVRRAQQLARELSDWIGLLSLPSQYGTGRWRVSMPYPNEPAHPQGHILMVDMAPTRRRAPMVRWQISGAGGRSFRYTEHRGDIGEDEDSTGAPLNFGVLP